MGRILTPVMFPVSVVGQVILMNNGLSSEIAVGKLIYSAKWTVLDEEIAEPDAVSAIVKSLSIMDKKTAERCLKKGLQVEINGEMRLATDLNIDFGYITIEQDIIYIKNMELTWDSGMNAEEYGEKYGESMFMMFEFDGNRAPFRSHESYGIYNEEEYDACPK